MGKDDDDQVTISRRELDELKGKGMSKEEKTIRGIVRDELAGALRDFFKSAPDDEDEDEESGDSIGAGVRKLFGLGG